MTLSGQILEMRTPVRCCVNPAAIDSCPENGLIAMLDEIVLNFPIIFQSDCVIEYVVGFY
jgi:hypothetical protein